jgi:hypothetical protein
MPLFNRVMNVERRSEYRKRAAPTGKSAAYQGESLEWRLERM